MAVEIEGRRLSDVIAIPRNVLREDDTVWVANSARQLEIRSVTVARLDENTAFLDRGLQAGEMVVVTHLQGATAGLALAPLEAGEQP